MARGFVGRAGAGEKIWLYELKNGRRTKVRDLRWGDYLNIQGSDGAWTRIKWGTQERWLKSRYVVDERPLEVIFLDVGQGDGCLVVSPEAGDEERILIVDAGVSDNMFRFVKWRFGKLVRDFRFHAAVITHPDKDHYYGFQKLFSHDKVHFDRLFHNGLLERTGDDLLGASEEGLLTDLGLTDQATRQLYSDPDRRGGKLFPKLMHTALTSGRVGRVEALNTDTSHVPGFEPGARSFSLEVLGPVLARTAAGKPGLRWFGDHIGSQARSISKTKNGHSVLLRLVLGDFRLMLGGDLNRPAEDHLLRHHSGIAANQPLEDAVEPARARLRSDVLKCCHHGASDVTDEFLRAVDPFAFIVSSGDEESHAHPRPELLGRLGKSGRGAAPHIFCTEILRSGPEDLAKEMKKLQKLEQVVEDPGSSDQARARARQERADLQRHLSRRIVGVYGAITLRTDGQHLQLSFRLESPRGKQLWQTAEFAWDGADWVGSGAGGH
jgi:beta-lactamase superfamily II metal-dependent hydrolase